MWRSIIGFVLWSLSLSLPSQAEQQPRLALLIGNQKYNTKVGTLKYPHQDVAKIKASLEKLGFQVKDLEDVDYKTMDVEIKSYARELHDAGSGALGFFYYSGHGAADPDKHVNYLIPVDVKSANDKRLWDNSIRQDEIIDRLSREAGNAAHVVVFDACRNELNLPPAAGKAIGAEKGFTAIQDVNGMLIAYATAPNKSAADTGQFSAILAEELRRAGIEVAQIFRNVQLRVNDYMNQQPWLSVGGIRKTYFTAAPEGPCNAIELTAAGQKICRRPGDGQQFKDCEACPEMVLVPAGKVIFYSEVGFWNSFKQLFSSSDLRSAHEVRFGEPFAISRSPVTFDEWDACVAAGGCSGYTPSDEGGDRHNHPVINVSWDDARTYLSWLSARTGHAYRLLSEAERYYVSKNDQRDVSECNCDDVEIQYVRVFSTNNQMEYRPIPVAKKRFRTVPVHKYGANEWGLYQVRGNVDEWVEDCWRDTITGIPGDGTPWKTGDCENRAIVGRVVRESWLFAPYLEYRWSAKRSARDHFTSFRIVRTLNP